MIIRGVSLYGRLAVIFAFLMALTACGGGGGGGGGDFYDPNDGNDISIRITLLDPQGNETDTITSSAPGTVLVKVKGVKDGIVVNATTTIGEIFPGTGTALTDADGVATFQIEAGAQKGAGTFTATAQTEDGDVTGNLGFQVGEAGLRIGYFDDDGMFIENSVKIEPESTLAAGGNAQLSVVILNQDGEKVNTVEEVRFNSGCIASGQATTNPANPVSTANGEASTLYTAAGCSGTDEITASLVGAAAQAFGSLSIASPTANAINFVSAEPQLIVLRGTGGENRDETADVTFRVVDSTGAPLQGVRVDFALSTEVGGLALSTNSALSDGEGLARVTVSSGDIATTVRVIATADDGSGTPVSTASDLLSVTTGLPDQNSISLSVEGGFVVDQGMNVDGVTRTITVRMADKFNNPVVDGTSAVFTTEYGAIEGSCNTVDGSCSVQWRSQEPRFPTLTGNTFIQYTGFGNACPCPGDMGYTRGARSTIIVRAQGEESFIDRNGNGVMDEDEKDLFDNLPEAFIDHNEDGVYTPGLQACLDNPNTPRCIAGQEELFFDYNNNNQYDLNDDPAVYNGLLCPPEGDGKWCSRSLVEVRAQTVIALEAENTYGIRYIGSIEDGVAYIADIFNNPPPEGTSVSVEVNDGECELQATETTVPTAITYGSNGAFGVGISTSGWGTYSVSYGNALLTRPCKLGSTDPNEPS